MSHEELRALDRMLLADPERAMGLCGAPHGWLDVFCGWIPFLGN